MKACSVHGCTRQMKARTLCSYHYSRAYSEVGLKAMPPRFYADGWVNPLVCVCAVPDAHPRIDFGECRRCHRCPLVNFRILQKETAA